MRESVKSKIFTQNKTSNRGISVSLEYDLSGKLTVHGPSSGAKYVEIFDIYARSVTYMLQIYAGSCGQFHIGIFSHIFPHLEALSNNIAPQLGIYVLSITCCYSAVLVKNKWIGYSLINGL